MTPRAVLVLVCLSGCAAVSRPAGRDYAQSALQRFVLNQTTVDEVVAALGPPVSQGTMRGIARPTATIVPPGSVLAMTTLKYYYAPNGPGAPPSLHPSKSVALVFIADHLVGYGLTNTIPAEVYPPVDEGRLTGLHQGQTTRAEAIALLGPPTGQFVDVLGASTGNAMVEYGWSRAKDGNVTLRSLRLYFDSRDRMTSYAVLDNSFPAGQAPLLMPPMVPSPAVPTPMPGHAIPHPDLEHT